MGVRVGGRAVRVPMLTLVLAALGGAVGVYVYGAGEAGDSGEVVAEEFGEHLRRQSLGADVAVEFSRQAGDAI